MQTLWRIASQCRSVIAVGNTYSSLVCVLLQLGAATTAVCATGCGRGGPDAKQGAHVPPHAFTHCHTARIYLRAGASALGQGGLQLHLLMALRSSLWELVRGVIAIVADITGGAHVIARLEAQTCRL